MIVGSWKHKTTYVHGDIAERCRYDLLMLQKKKSDPSGSRFLRLAALKTLTGGWAGFSVPSFRFWRRSTASPPCQSRWSLCGLSDVPPSAWSSPECNWPPLLRRWCPIPKPRDLVRPLLLRQRSRTRHRFLVSPGGAEGEISRRFLSKKKTDTRATKLI